MRSPAVSRALPLGVPWIAAVLLAAPLLVVRAVPGSDMPFHEGLTAILRHFEDAAWNPGGLYVRSLAGPNRLFHVVAAACSWAFGVPFAVKLVAAVSVGGLLPATARTLLHFGAHPRGAAFGSLVVAPLAFGWALYWGFGPQLLGTTLLVALLPSLHRAVAAPNARTVATSTLALIVLLAAHEASVAVAGVISFVLAAARRGRLARFAPFAIATALSIAGAVLTAAHSDPLTRELGARWLWHGPLEKLRQLPGQLTGDVGLGPSLALVVLAIAASIALARPAREPSTSDGASRAPRDVALAAAALAGAFAVLPHAVNFGAFLYVRPLPLACILGLAAALAHRGPPSFVACAAASAVPLATISVALPQLAAAHDEAVAVDALADHVAEGSAVAFLAVGAQGEPLAFVPARIGARVLVRRGGRLHADFTTAPIAPVAQRDDLRWERTLRRLWSKPSALVPAHDFRQFRYVLIRRTDRTLDGALVASLAPDARPVADAGSWLLFESTHEVTPPASPELAGPAGSLPTWGARFAAARSAPSP